MSLTTGTSRLARPAIHAPAIGKEEAFQSRPSERSTAVGGSRELDFEGAGGQNSFGACERARINRWAGTQKGYPMRADFGPLLQHTSIRESRWSLMRSLACVVAFWLASHAPWNYRRPPAEDESLVSRAPADRIHLALATARALIVERAHSRGSPCEPIPGLFCNTTRSENRDGA